MNKDQEKVLKHAALNRYERQLERLMKDENDDSLGSVQFKMDGNQTHWLNITRRQAVDMMDVLIKPLKYELLNKD